MTPASQTVQPETAPGRGRLTVALPDPRLRGWRAAVPWVVVAVDLAFILVVLAAVGPSEDAGPIGATLFIAMAASLGLVGALVATRQPRNPVGWLLWISATLATIAISGADFVRWSQAAAEGGFPGTLAIAWLQGVVFLPAVILIIIVVPLYFPDGRLLSPRWRWVVLLAVAGIAVVAVPSAFTPGLLVGTDVENPLAIPGLDAAPIADLLGLANFGLSIAAFVLAAASCVLRYRRGTVTTRQQLKWYAAAVGWTLAWLTCSFLVPPLADLGWFLGLVGVVLLPAAIGIAILRYRLYDIDRIVSRTISWAVVTVLLLGLFTGTVVMIQGLVKPVTGDSPIAVAASTLLAAALFHPLRRRVQGTIDRRFNRARYDAEQLSMAFADRLRDEIGLDEIAAELRSTVDAAVHPAGTGLWLRVDGPPRSP